MDREIFSDPRVIEDTGKVGPDWRSKDKRGENKCEKPRQGYFGSNNLQEIKNELVNTEF